MRYTRSTLAPQGEIAATHLACPHDAPWRVTRNSETTCCDYFVLFEMSLHSLCALLSLVALAVTRAGALDATDCTYLLAAADATRLSHTSDFVDALGDMHRYYDDNNQMTEFVEVRSARWLRGSARPVQRTAPTLAVQRRGGS